MKRLFKEFVLNDKKSIIEHMLLITLIMLWILNSELWENSIMIKHYLIYLMADMLIIRRTVYRFDSLSDQMLPSKSFKDNLFPSLIFSVALAILLIPIFWFLQNIWIGAIFVLVIFKKSIQPVRYSSIIIVERIISTFFIMMVFMFLSVVVENNIEKNAVLNNIGIQTLTFISLVIITGVQIFLTLRRSDILSDDSLYMEV